MPSAFTAGFSLTETTVRILPESTMIIAPPRHKIWHGSCGLLGPESRNQSKRTRCWVGQALESKLGLEDKENTLALWVRKIFSSKCFH